MSHIPLKAQCDYETVARSVFDRTGQRPKLVVIGALHVDEIARSSETMILGESNPVSWTRSAGGVAANVSRAAAITCPELFIQLIANCGTDSDADQLRAVMKNSCVNVISTKLSDSPAGRYTAVLQPDGDVLIGLADTAQAEQLSYETIADQVDLRSASAVFFDGNISAHTMEQLTRQLPRRCPAVAMSVSPAKATRLNACLPDLDLLFCNRAEAKAMVQHLGHAVELTTDSAALLSRLCDTACKHVVLTDGIDGVYIGSGAEKTHAPVIALNNPKTLNGPGDALAGATIARLVNQSLTHSAIVDAICNFGIPAANAVLLGNNRAPLISNHH
ncbi:PfkB family carbohydrate kinase [bacterium]|nr:PfkB family carbohydrate kinase [bacterium]